MTLNTQKTCHYDHHQCQQQPQQKNQQIVCGNSLTVKPSYTHRASIDATAEVKKYLTDVFVPDMTHDPEVVY